MNKLVTQHRIPVTPTTGTKRSRIKVRDFVLKLKDWLLFLTLFLSLVTSPGYADQDNELNIYTWANEIPEHLIVEFEQQTGIHVNFSTYDSNETLFTKLKTSRHGVYDIVNPSSYFVSQMRQQNLLLPLDKSLLTNYKNIDPFFLKSYYDYNNHYSIPLVWGTTGIFYNTRYIKSEINSWKQLWDKQYKNQVLLIDDLREVFSIALLKNSLSPNSQERSEIKQSFHTLLKLLPNIKLFGGDAIQSLLIDDEVHIGMVWNNDFRKAYQENKSLRFVYPTEGFVIWIDCLSIPANAPHKANAYRFLNFILKASSGKAIALNEGYAIPNAAAKKLLPKEMVNDKVIYPDVNTLKRGYRQQAINKKALKTYNHYWQLLKISA